MKPLHSYCRCSECCALDRAHRREGRQLALFTKPARPAPRRAQSTEPAT